MVNLYIKLNIIITLINITNIRWSKITVRLCLKLKKLNIHALLEDILLTLVPAISSFNNCNT